MFITHEAYNSRNNLEKNKPFLTFQIIRKMKDNPNKSEFSFSME